VKRKRSENCRSQAAIRDASCWTTAGSSDLLLETCRVYLATKGVFRSVLDPWLFNV
jgi:hypothetical protein